MDVDRQNRKVKRSSGDIYVGLMANLTRGLSSSTSLVSSVHFHPSHPSIRYTRPILVSKRSTQTKKREENALAPHPPPRTPPRNLPSPPRPPTLTTPNLPSNHLPLSLAPDHTNFFFFLSQPTPTNPHLHPPRQQKDTQRSHAPALSVQHLRPAPDSAHVPALAVYTLIGVLSPTVKTHLFSNSHKAHKKVVYPPAPRRTTTMGVG